MDEKNEYIKYLSSFDDTELNENIIEFRNNTIEFDELESNAISKMYLSKFNYFKTFKIGSILRNSKL